MNKIANFRNEVEVQNLDVELDHNRIVYSFGSCFSNQMIKYFENNGFRTFSPFGTIYNPITISNNIKKALGENLYSINDLVQLNEVFFSWHHSGKYFDFDSKNLLNKINNELISNSENLKKRPLVLVTFGSSIVYKLKSNGLVVGNCHKLKSSLFEKTKLSIKEITVEWSKIISSLDADFIFTVSPVRHIRNGLVENNRSKSILLLAVEELCKLNPNNTSYFPSYEIMIDELRDYRFYKNDWVHPSQEAVDFIWSKFSSSLFSSSSLKINNEVKKIRLALAHQSNYGMTKDHRLFLKKLKISIIDIKKKTPLYDWEKEIKLINEQLA